MVDLGIAKPNQHSAKFATSSTISTATSWNVTRQDIVRKVVDGKIGATKVESSPKTSTSKTKPTTGDVW